MWIGVGVVVGGMRVGDDDMTNGVYWRAVLDVGGDGGNDGNGHQPCKRWTAMRWEYDISISSLSTTARTIFRQNNIFLGKCFSGI